jgi:hypothetical protein
MGRPDAQSLGTGTDLGLASVQVGCPLHRRGQVQPPARGRGGVRVVDLRLNRDNVRQAYLLGNALGDVRLLVRPKLAPPADQGTGAALRQGEVDAAAERPTAFRRQWILQARYCREISAIAKTRD